MDCKCGHGISKHDMGGCQHTVRKTDEFDLVCKCGLTPDAIADAQLAALREAGEKMAQALQDVLHDRPSAHTDNVWENVNAALAEWEAANK